MNDPSNLEWDTLHPPPPLLYPQPLLPWLYPVKSWTHSSLSYSGKTKKRKEKKTSSAHSTSCLCPQAKFLKESPVFVSLSSLGPAIWIPLCAVTWFCGSHQWVPSPRSSHPHPHLIAVFTTSAHSLPWWPRYFMLLVFFSLPWPLPLGMCACFSSLTRPKGLVMDSPLSLLCLLFLGDATCSWAQHATSISWGHQGFLSSPDLSPEFWSSSG